MGGRLADHDRARGAESGDALGVGRRHVEVRGRPGARRDTRDVDHVLHGDRDPVQRSPIEADRELVVTQLCFGVRVRALFDEAAELAHGRARRRAMSSTSRVAVSVPRRSANAASTSGPRPFAQCRGARRVPGRVARHLRTRVVVEGRATGVIVALLAPQPRERVVERRARGAAGDGRGHAPSADKSADDGATAPNTPPCIVTIFKRGEVVVVVGGAGAVGEQQALVAAVVGVAHRRVHAHVGGDAGEHEVGDAVSPQQEIEVGGVERALARLVDHELAVDGRDLGHDLPARARRARGCDRTARSRRSRRRCAGTATACWAGSRRGRGDALRACGSPATRPRVPRRAPWRWARGPRV